MATVIANKWLDQYYQSKANIFFLNKNIFTHHKNIVGLTKSALCNDSKSKNAKSKKNLKIILGPFLFLSSTQLCMIIKLKRTFCTFYKLRTTRSRNSAEIIATTLKKVLHRPYALLLKLVTHWVIYQCGNATNQTSNNYEWSKHLSTSIIWQCTINCLRQWSF